MRVSCDVPGVVGLTGDPKVVLDADDLQGLTKIGAIKLLRDIGTRFPGVPLALRSAKAFVEAIQALPGGGGSELRYAEGYDVGYCDGQKYGYETGYADGCASIAKCTSARYDPNILADLNEYGEPACMLNRFIQETAFYCWADHR